MVVSINTVLAAYQIRDLVHAAQINHLMAANGLTFSDLEKLLARESRLFKEKATAGEPPAFRGSGLWPPPVKSRARGEWLKRLSAGQRREYSAWRKGKLANQAYGKRKP